MGSVFVCPDAATSISECIEVDLVASAWAEGLKFDDVIPLFGPVMVMLVIGFVIQRIRRTMGG